MTMHLPPTNLIPAAYANGWAPYRSVLERLVLPPRGPRGSKMNRRRWLAVGAALHQEKYRNDPTHKRSKCKLCKVKVELSPCQS